MWETPGRVDRAAAPAGRENPKAEVVGATGSGYTAGPHSWLGVQRFWTDLGSRGRFFVVSFPPRSGRSPAEPRKSAKNRARVFCFTLRRVFMAPQDGWKTCPPAVQFWPALSNFGQPCPILAKFGQVWPILSRTCRVGEAVAPFSGSTWGIEVRKIHIHFGKMILPADGPFGVREFITAFLSPWSGFLCRPLLPGVAIELADRGRSPGLRDDLQRNSPSRQDGPMAAGFPNRRQRVLIGPRLARPGAGSNCQRSAHRQVVNSSHNSTSPILASCSPLPAAILPSIHQYNTLAISASFASAFGVPALYFARLNVIL